MDTDDIREAARSAGLDLYPHEIAAAIRATADDRKALARDHPPAVAPLTTLPLR